MQSWKWVFHVVLWEDGGPFRPQASTPLRHGVPQSHISCNRFRSKPHGYERALWLPRRWNSSRLSTSYRNFIRYIPRRSTTEQGNGSSRLWESYWVYIGQCFFRNCYQVLLLEGFVHRHLHILRNPGGFFVLDHAFDPKIRFSPFRGQAIRLSWHSSYGSWSGTCIGSIDVCTLYLVLIKANEFPGKVQNLVGIHARLS
jgi:hypothetical protein